MASRDSLSRRYRGTFFFFPVFLPLAEVASWLLALLGIVAGVAGFSAPDFWRRHRGKVLAGAALCLAGALGFYLYARPDAQTVYEGTRAIAAQDLPLPHFIGAARPAMRQGQRQDFGEIWSVPVGRQILSTPVVMGDALIFGGYDGTIEARSLRDGAPVWTLALKEPVFALTPGGDGILYAGQGLHFTRAAGLTALEAGTGRIIWQREFLGHLEETLALDEARQRLWVGTGPGGLWAVDAGTGNILWHQALGHIDSQPLAFKDTVFVPAQPDENNAATSFFALNAQSGEILWQAPLRDQPWGSPLMDKTGSIILTTTGRGQIGVARTNDSGWAQALSASDGKILWEKQLPSMPLQPSFYLRDGDLIIHTVKSGDIIALHAADGSLAWQAKAGDEFQAGATLIEGYGQPLLASTSYDGVFSIRNALTGQELARRMVAKKTTAAPVARDGVMYVSTTFAITAFGGLQSLAGGEGP